jgi:hypothetical protein
MTPEQTVLRAYHAIGQGIGYGLGHGGMHPDDELPTRDGLCDCSGFALWCLGLCRHRKDDQWMDTSWIVDDAQKEHLEFQRVGWKAAKPGMLVVYGDRKDATGRTRQGHVGIITASNPVNGPMAVVHCSHGNASVFGDAIHETGPEAWATRGIVVRRSDGVTEA